MSELFNNVSSVLRDRQIIELQEQNRLLNNKIRLVEKLLYGTKVKLLAPIHGIYNTEEGILVDIVGYNAHILLKDDSNNVCLRSIYINQIVFLDNKISEFYNQKIHSN